MNVIEKNEGAKVPYSVDGNKITIRDEMTLDVSKYERDYPVNLDICNNKDGILIVGLSDYYVAQLEIPERQYTEETVGEDVTMVPVPFDMDNVTLVLWALVGGEV